MIGKILGNRYQVVEKIGDGGTAFVYKGMDNLLNRHVTVKVLRPEYVSDQDFVRRFRREAQAAAGLSHPNIVSIYDVGFEEGIHYIVMEYIEGQSLKELINDMGELPVRMAVEYAAQIGHALEKAHKHGIVHRDVKPHNILISEDGRVKVTDFGIAQAVTASTMTYNGAILGSVHYFSPEQASGGLTGEKSDIYSLGVVLYEMLTGQVPFSGESPVSIAVKHLQEPFPRPREVNPEMPEKVERIIRKAVEKDPENRFRSAKEMSAELSNWLAGREGSQAIIPANDDEVDQTRRESRPKTKKKLKPIHWVAIIAGVLLLAGLIFGIAFLRNYLIVPDVTVPDVEGEPLTRAQQMLREAGLNYRVTEEGEPSITVPAGHVLSQDPEPNRTVKQDREIILTLSSGPDLVEVDNVVGRMRREATLQLEASGFEVEVEERYSDEPPGRVISQDPSGGHRITRGSTVTIEVSIGGRPFELRDLRGLTLDDARNWLNLYDLEIGHVREEHNDDYAAGVVMGQHPDPGEEVQSGDRVDLTVSKGPDQVELEQHEIRINTDDIPLEEEVTVIIRDAYGERTEEYINDGEPIETFGWGSGEVEVRWQDNVETKSFP
ncbi:Stk1 family PASTA domain-containing Ser/Thr kinase [Dethiobacter alkaliphilus]|uniref:Stk1 family PASTA domain-containing Ser/Thr kinase n=1 Tax=Dethiobacter alkaliphilus TaxID=427926 RepID=UPI0022261DC0|nr:Stk1 family PASTA domain-containing Ser/Thr kinase [Dethiobacter alkaliphilus]MCW3490893.1 Stk1 family PASTA domain-containing Ser/Thr kinase [Dethiobacter alkaliphilus]